MSQQTIEDRPLITNLLILPSDFNINNKTILPDYKNAEIVWIDEINLTELSFEQLKRYLEIAGDSNSYLIISESETESFIFKGFLFLKESLDSWSFTDIFNIIMYNSIIFSINNKNLKVSLGNETFLRIEKNALFEVPTFSEEIDSALSVSTVFKTNALNITTENGYFDFLPNYHDIELIVRDALRMIITTIADMRHGATLIFGSQWKIDDDTRFQFGSINVKVPIGTIIQKKCENLNIVLMSDGDLLEVYTRSKKIDEIRKDAVRDIQDELMATKKSIINLSKTDGALVFNLNLDVIGAGVFIKMTSTTTVSGGARRKSAESFVKANPGTAAIVISQDGMVYLFSSKD